jgi:hypothetical protein
MDFCEGRGLSWPLEAPPKLASNPWFAVHTQREQEVVIIAELDKKKFTDASQQVTRSRCTDKEECPTLLPGCNLWSFELGRPLIGRDMLNLQGFPWMGLPCIENFTEKNLADLGGNAFSATCSLAVDLAVLLNLSYGPESDAEESAEIHDLMSFMQEDD